MLVVPAHRRQKVEWVLQHLTRRLLVSHVIQWMTVALIKSMKSFFREWFVVLQQQRSVVLIYVLHTAVVNAFKSPYIGNTAALEKAIDQVINDKSLHANAIPFVQSSGTGKSRLMKELGMKVFVLVLNLREDDRIGEFCKYCWKQPVLKRSCQ